MPKDGIRSVLALLRSNVKVGCMGCRSGLYSVVLWPTHGGAHVGWWQVDKCSIARSARLAEIIGEYTC
jgi:hypothetical protein